MSAVSETSASPETPTVTAEGSDGDTPAVAVLFVVGLGLLWIGSGLRREVVSRPTRELGSLPPRSSSPAATRCS